QQPVLLRGKLCGPPRKLGGVWPEQNVAVRRDPRQHVFEGAFAALVILDQEVKVAVQAGPDAQRISGLGAEPRELARQGETCAYPQLRRVRFASHVMSTS